MMSGCPIMNNHEADFQVVPISDIKIVEHGELLWEEGDANKAKTHSCPIITITCHGQNIEALVDTGCSQSVISEEMLKKITSNSADVPVLPVRKSYLIGANMKKSAPVTKQALLQINVGSCEYECICLVVNKLSYPLIIGMDFLTEYRAIINLENRTIHLNQQPLVFNETENVHEEEVTINCLSTDIEIQIGEKLSKYCHLSEDQRQQLLSLLLNYSVIFTKGKEPVKNYEFSIELFDDTPFQARPYPIPKAYSEEVFALIKEMEEEKIIRRAATAYTSPLVIVRKKNGSLRICLDARRLNSVTVPFRDVPPRINEVLQEFSGKCWFTSTDLTAAYWQIPIQPSSQQYTGFLVNGVSYVFCRTPFGLRNSGAALIQCVDRILRDAMGKHTTVYVDDVLISTETFDEQLLYLEQFFKIMLDNNFRLNLTKSDFCVKQINFLGYVINEKGTSISDDKIKEIDRIAPPRNKRQLRSLLGTIGYYSRFCKNYSLVVAPLYYLLKKDRKREWTPMHQKTFDEIKMIRRTLTNY